MHVRVCPYRDRCLLNADLIISKALPCQKIYWFSNYTIGVYSSEMLRSLPRVLEQSILFRINERFIGSTEYYMIHKYAIRYHARLVFSATVVEVAMAGVII
jgi:hypothetical protein